MKILIYSQCFAPKLGGIEKVMTNIATESFNLKNEVTVITDGSKSTVQNTISLKNLKFIGLIKLNF